MANEKPLSQRLAQLIREDAEDQRDEQIANHEISVFSQRISIYIEQGKITEAEKLVVDLENRDIILESLRSRRRERNAKIEILRQEILNEKSKSQERPLSSSWKRASTINLKMNNNNMTSNAAHGPGRPMSEAPYSEADPGSKLIFRHSASASLIQTVNEENAKDIFEVNAPAKACETKPVFSMQEGNNGPPGNALEVEKGFEVATSTQEDTYCSKESSDLNEKQAESPSNGSLKYNDIRRSRMLRDTPVIGAIPHRSSFHALHMKMAPKPFPSLQEDDFVLIDGAITSNENLLPVHQKSATHRLGNDSPENSPSAIPSDDASVTRSESKQGEHESQEMEKTEENRIIEMVNPSDQPEFLNVNREEAAKKNAESKHGSSLVKEETENNTKDLNKRESDGSAIDDIQQYNDRMEAIRKRCTQNAPRQIGRNELDHSISECFVEISNEISNDNALEGDNATFVKLSKGSIVSSSDAGPLKLSYEIEMEKRERILLETDNFLHFARIKSHEEEEQFEEMVRSALANSKLLREQQQQQQQAKSKVETLSKKGTESVGTAKNNAPPENKQGHPTARVVDNKMDEDEDWVIVEQSKKEVVKNQAKSQPNPAPENKKSTLEVIKSKIAGRAECAVKECGWNEGLAKCRQCGRLVCALHLHMLENGWRPMLVVLHSRDPNGSASCYAKETTSIRARNCIPTVRTTNGYKTVAVNELWCNECYNQLSNPFELPSSNLTPRFLMRRRQIARERNQQIAATEKRVLDHLQNSFPNNSTQFISIANSIVSKNPFNNVVWSVKDTWMTCNECSRFFQRLEKKFVCELCSASLCQKCGISKIEFNSKILQNNFGDEITTKSVCKKCYEYVCIKQYQFNYPVVKKAEGKMQIRLLSSAADDLIALHEKSMHQKLAVERLLVMLKHCVDGESINPAINSNNPNNTSSRQQIRQSLDRALKEFQDTSNSILGLGGKSVLSITETRLYQAIKSANMAFLRKSLNELRAIESIYKAGVQEFVQI